MGSDAVRGGRLFSGAVLLAGLMASAALPSLVRAQVLPRFAVHGEFGGGWMLAAPQRDRAHEDGAVAGAVRLGVRLFEPLSVTLSYEGWLFPSGSGQAHDVFGGVRIEPKLGNVGRLWLDGNVGLTFTGPLTRLGLSVGLGFDFQVLPWLAVGPYVRYAHVFATSEDFPSDASVIAGGLSVTLSVPEEHHAPPPTSVVPDRDRDLVPDARDLCPDVSEGAHRDPARPGCPLTDRDRDGIQDPDDRCPTEPVGIHPDPARRGCPAPDSDGDGVLDADEVCPSTAAGPHPDPSRPGCPDADRDGDGVYDHLDSCPNERPGLHPDPERPGCPAPDADGDNVPDAADACPSEPGSPSTDTRRNGCPGLVHVEQSQIRIDRPVFFATRRDRVLHSSSPVLQAVAEALLATPEIARISVEGYTDDVGDDAANQDLSERRAANVMAWLIRAGVSASRLESHGYGESAPLVQATTEDARGVNRRVEFRIIESGPSPTTTPARGAP